MKAEMPQVKVTIVRVPVPRNHPRFESLMVRERMVEGLVHGLVVPEGLIAHGRGECFDYLIGEKTEFFALEAIRAAAAAFLLAKKPTISVNGNLAALCARELVKLSKATGASLEVNLFYRSRFREQAIASALKKAGASKILGVNASKHILGLESFRGLVEAEGIGEADLVLLGIEDGDRVMALRRAGKRIIVIDLNPLSRSALDASITIIDNVVRALPRLRLEVERLREASKHHLHQTVASYDNRRILAEALNHIRGRLEILSSNLASGRD